MNPSPFHLDAGGDKIPDELHRKMLEILLERFRHEKDFPSLSESVITINRIVSSEWESISSLSNAILKDFALTNKLLKLVNSAAYIPYGGGNISTVSRAVAILGFDGVKSIALTLLILDHLESKKDAAHLKNEFLHALFSATLAREVSERTFARCAEEAFVCSMFHNLGRLLAMFYLSDEEEQIRRLMVDQSLSEDAAALQVLGMPLRELGSAVACDWHFPEQIIHSMETLPPGPMQLPEANQDKLRMLAVFADELCTTIAHTGCRDMPREIRNIVERFADGLPLTEKQLLEAVDATLDDVIEYANIIQLNLHDIPFGQRISQTIVEPTDADGQPIHNARGCATESSREEEALYADSPAEHGNPTILTAGLSDISEALVEENPLNDALHIILETLYRGLEFRRVLLCTVDAQENAMVARFGFGPAIEDVLPHFRFPLNGTTDLFQAAVNRGVDVVISNAADPHMRERIPAWHRKHIPAQTFALFPLKIEGTPVGMIYVDKAQAGTIHFNETEKKLLRTLRNQAILAMKQFIRITP
ncbi:MAG: HDOD domain-containing protein [Sulfuricella sp.]|nr:HDOD domain-containing protein [Sulfuricella sp.]